MVIMVLQLLSGAAVLLLPGAALLVCLGVRERLWFAGMAGPMNAGLVLLTAMFTGVLGIRFDVWSHAVVTLVLLLLVAGTRLVLARLRRGTERVAGSAVQTGPPPAAETPARTLHGAARQVATTAAGLMAMVSIAGGMLMWLRGLGSLTTISQEHDPILHHVLTAYIRFTGRAAPWQIMPLDITDGRQVSFYPSGLPSMAALVSDVLGGNAILGMNVTVVLVFAVLLPLSSAALGAAVARTAGLGRGWTDLAAGTAALLSIALYRPAVSFAHDGGMMPNGVALAMAPGLIATIIVLGRRRWAQAAALGIACAGVLAIHGSAAATVVLTVLSMAVGLLLTREGRRRIRDAVPPLVVTGVVAGVLAAPAMIAASAVTTSVTDFPPDIAATPLRGAIRNILTLTYAGFLDTTGTLNQRSLAALALAGALAVLVFRAGWAVLTAWLFWVAANISFQLSPTSGFGAAIAGPYYNSFTRLESHVYLLVPTMAAMAITLTAAAATRWAISRPRLTARAIQLRPVAAVGVVAAVIAGLTVTKITDYAERNTDALSNRYATPEFNRYDSDDEAAAGWLREHVKQGERILNNGNDGSTIAYVRYGLPILSIYSMGQSQPPYTVEFLKKFNTYPENAEIRDTLHEFNVRWIYVDESAPTITPDAKIWPELLGVGYSLAPGLADIDGLPGLSIAFRSGDVIIYELDVERLAPDDGR
jgi:Family of unknown function (DUF6541)